MKGVLLAGGMGTRLLPLTGGVSKQLMPVYDKPMIYYPLTTLMLAGVQEIAIITRPDQRQSFQNLLGDGSDWGLQITYLDQNAPNGIAESLLIADEFLAGSPSALALGDNLFHGSGLGRSLSRASVSSGAKIFGFRVSNPNDYGVVVLDGNKNPKRIVEKPEQFLSDIAIPGLYFFDPTAPERARHLDASPRGELEITDLLEAYLSEGSLALELLPRGTVWLDTGTIDSLAEAADYVRVVQKRQGTLIGSPEEAAWRLGLIGDDQLRLLAQKLTKSEYGHYLLDLVGG